MKGRHVTDAAHSVRTPPTAVGTSTQMHDVIRSKNTQLGRGPSALKLFTLLLKGVLTLTTPPNVGGSDFPEHVPAFRGQ